MRRAAALCLALLGCGRDLTVPSAVVAPEITALAPGSGFAGDTVTVSFDRPAPAGVGVRFGGLDAALVVSADRASAQAVVPAGGAAGSVDVTAVAGSASSKARAFALLGAGELRGSDKAATIGFVPYRGMTFPTPGAAFAGSYASLDPANGRLLVTGDAVNLSVATGDGSSYAFRTAQGIAVLSGFRSVAGDSTSARLRTFVLSAPAGGPPSIAEPAAPLAAPRFQRYGAALAPAIDASPSGARLAIPADGSGIAVMDTATGAVATVAPKGMTAQAQAARWAGESLLVTWSANRFFLFDPANPNAATTGTAIADPNAGAAGARPAGLDPAHATLAYLRADGRIGLVPLSDPALQPRAGSIGTFYTPIALVWSADSKILYVASVDPSSADRALVEAFDAASLALLGAARLPVDSLALGEQGADAGLPVVAYQRSVQVLTPGLQPARESDHAMVSGLAVASDNALLVSGALGLTRVEPLEFGIARLSGSANPDSLKSGQGEAIGWTGAAVYLWNAPAKRFDPFATASGPVQDADLSAASDWLAAVTAAGDVQVFHAGTAAAATLGGLVAPRVAFSGGLLWVAHVAGSDALLDVYTPGQQQPQASIKLTALLGAATWLCPIPGGGVLATGILSTSTARAGRVAVVPPSGAPWALNTVLDVAKAAACAPDGRQLAAWPPGAGVAADSLFTYTLDGPRRVLGRAELDFDAPATAIAWSRDGARLFAALGDHVAVIE